MNETLFKRYALLGLFIPALTLGACSGGAETKVAKPTTTQTSAAQAAPVVQSRFQDENGNIPAATIGNTQRTWPDPNGRIDDSAHATPGQYSTDVLGRPVWTPINHDGDLPKKSDLDNDFDDSKCAPLPELDGETQIQYVNARYLVVNKRYGPTVMDEGVPRGYAHHPYGAILAAMNQVGYAMYAQGDEIGHKVDEELWSTSQIVAQLREQYGFSDSQPTADDRASSALAAGAVRLVYCSENATTVEVAINPGDGRPIMFGRLAMMWRDNDWQADFTGENDKGLMQPPLENFDGFSVVNYAGPQH